MSGNDLYKGEWEFLKLFIGLNTALIGGWFLAQDRLIHSRFAMSVYILTLCTFGVSLAFLFAAVRLLVSIEMAGIGKILETPSGEMLFDRTDFWKAMKDYRTFVNCSIFSCGIGLVWVVMLIVYNVVHQHLPKFG